jgi:hypothetical protein
MFPKNNVPQEDHMASSSTPTSPWTEPYQSASDNQQAERRAFDGDDQYAHNALSDFYDQRYE